MVPIERIQQALIIKRCVPVVGAGASIAAGGPAWQEYINKMRDGLPAEVFSQIRPDGDLTEIAALLRDERARLWLPPIEVPDGAPGIIHAEGMQFKQQIPGGRKGGTHHLDRLHQVIGRINDEVGMLAARP